MAPSWICSTLRPCSRSGGTSSATAAAASPWSGGSRSVSRHGGRIASFLHEAVACSGASSASVSTGAFHPIFSAVRSHIVPAVRLNNELFSSPYRAIAGVSASAPVAFLLRPPSSASATAAAVAGSLSARSRRASTSTGAVLAHASSTSSSTATAEFPHEVEGRELYNNAFSVEVGKDEEQVSSGIDFTSPDVGAACTAGKSIAQLLNGAGVYSMCACKPLVKNAERLLLLSEKIIGKKLTTFLLRSTVFRVFCGGEDVHQVIKTMKLLEQKGVKSALDYSVEACPGEEEEGEARGKEDDGERNSYYYENLRLTIEAAAGAAQQEAGFAAVKVTAFGSVSVMERSSTLLRAADCLFARLTGVPICEEMGRAPPEVLLQQTLPREKFLLLLQQQQVDPASAAGLFDSIKQQSQHTGEGGSTSAADAAAKDKDAITYLQWMNACQPHKIGRGALAPLSQLGLTPLSEGDVHAIEETLERVDRLCSETLDMQPNVPSLLVDAEHSPIQPFIRFAALEAMKKHNRKGRILVFNTYQCYLRETQGQLSVDLEWARQQGIPFGVKLVRGAYIRFETELAEKLGKKCSPVFDCIEDTHSSYDTCARLLVQRLPRIAVFFGTHNVSSLQRATALLSSSSAGSPSDQDAALPSHPNVYFGQLLGLGDYLTFALAKRGYKVYKYVPYGPVNITVPYLLRRAQEVGCMPGGVSKELTFVAQEFKRRLLSPLRFSSSRKQ